MTKSNVIPLEAAIKREDRRLLERARREENVRRKLLPLMVLVCETYRVSADDILDPQNKHPTVAMARDIVRWLGYTRLHIGTSYLSVAMNQHRAGCAQAIQRIKVKLERYDFKRQVECIEKLMDAAVK